MNPCDLETTHEYAADIENTKYMIHLPNDTIDDTKAFLQRADKEWQKANPAYYEFAVILDGKHIGAVSLYPDISKRECEIGWIISKGYQKNGYAFEAAGAVLNYAKSELNIKRAIAHCDYRNEASFRLMRRLGMSLERGDGVRQNKGSTEETQELMYSVEL